MGAKNSGDIEIDQTFLLLIDENPLTAFRSDPDIRVDPD